MIGHPCGRVVALLLAIVMGVAVTSCDTSAPDPADDGAVPIGGLFSLTGNWSTLGRTSKAALEFAVEDVNRHLQDTGASLRLEPVVEDTRLEPALALAGAQALRMRASRRGLTLGSIRKGRMIGCADTSIIAPFPEVPSHLGTARSRLRPAA